MSNQYSCNYHNSKMVVMMMVMMMMISDFSFPKGVQGPPGSRGVQGHEASAKLDSAFVLQNW